MTTASASESWSAGAGEPDGAGEWSCDGSADAPADAAAGGAAADAPGEPPGGGGVDGPYVHDGTPAAGAQAATLAATRPPPAIAAVRRNPLLENDPAGPSASAGLLG